MSNANDSKGIALIARIFLCLLPNGALAPNGFAALAALDSNGDGVSQVLVNMIGTFMGSSAQERQAQIDGVLYAWGYTSSSRSAPERRPWRNIPGSITSTFADGSVAEAIEQLAKNHPANYQRLSTLEQFAGQDLIERFIATRSGSYLAGIDKLDPNNWRYITHWVDIRSMRMNFFNQAHEQLYQDVYKALYFETAGEPNTINSIAHCADSMPGKCLKGLRKQSKNSQRLAGCRKSKSSLSTGQRENLWI